MLPEKKINIIKNKIMKLFKIKKLNYVVNKSKGIVVCIAEVEPTSELDYSLTYEEEIKIHTKFPYVITSLHGKPFIIKAIAKCSPEDKFDEILGKRIAEGRVKYKLFITTAKVANFIANLRIKQADDFLDISLEALKNSNKEKNHIQSLIK